jgi:hypothetical protein
MGNGSALSKVCLADQRDNAAAMELCFEQAVIEVWRQALVENADVVLLGTERYPVRRTPKCGLRQVALNVSAFVRLAVTEAVKRKQEARALDHG